VNKTEISEWVAAALAAAIVWLPLFMAPASVPVPQSVGVLPQHAVIQNEFQEIIFGTHITDWVLAAVGIGQLVILGRQIGIASRQNVLIAGQNAISSQAYIAAHRPRLVIRDVYLIRDQESEIAPRAELCVHYILANVGGSSAKIIAGGFIIHKWRKLSQPFTSDTDATHFPAHVTLQPGESFDDRIPMEISKDELNEILVSHELQKLNAPGVSDFDLVFRGGVVYVDDNGIKRRTSVWRICVGPPSLRMKAIDDPDYEYAD